ncbi:substrate-binding domain-containing protein [Streptomyces sp. S9]|nr:substrate-binding domain-containing protein [Streptomyces sp. S9]
MIIGTRARHLVALFLAAVLTVCLASCGDGGARSERGFTVGLLLPSRSLPRWENADKPLIEEQLKARCPACTLTYANAENDAARQRQQLISMITKGARVLIVDAADTKALRSSIYEAHRAGVPVVAYDRLAEGPIAGYIGFDGAQVGRLQGQALLNALGDEAEDASVVMMNGDPTSPNAAWYREGALSVLRGRVDIARSYDTPGWNTQEAHTNMVAALAALGPEGIDAVYAANDAIAAGVISALKSAGVRKMPPITGQDADLDAVRRIVKGEQYMTVYKAFRDEAASAVAMAVALGRGEDPGGSPTTIDSPTTRDIPAVLLSPTSITVDDIGPVLVDGGVYPLSRICVPRLREACAAAGLTG